MRIVPGSLFVVLSIITLVAAAGCDGTAHCVTCGDPDVDGGPVADASTPPVDGRASECVPGDRDHVDCDMTCEPGSTDRVCGADGRWASGDCVPHRGCNCASGCGMSMPDAGTPDAGPTPTDAGSDTPDGGMSMPVDASTPPATPTVDVYHVVVTTPAGDPARTIVISQHEDWDSAITPPACVLRDEDTVGGTLLRHECDIAIVHGHPAVFNAEFNFVAPSGTRRQLVIWSCNQDSSGTPFDHYGTMTVTLAGAPVSQQDIDNASDATRSGRGCNIRDTATPCPDRMHLAAGVCTF